MDGWMDGTMDGWKSLVKDCLQQSTNGVNLIRIESCFDFLIIDNFKKLIYKLINTKNKIQVACCKLLTRFENSFCPVR